MHQSVVGIENILGSEASDLLAANGAGNILEGRGGNDRLFSNAGIDRLVGGAGADTLVGGSEADNFFFNSADESPTGFLTRDKRGVWAYFAIVPEALNALSAVLAAPTTALTGLRS